MERLALMDALAMTGNASARERMARLLVDFHTRLSPIDLVVDDGFHLPLTQEIIGDLLGLTAVHVNRTIRGLEEEGLWRDRDTDSSCSTCPRCDACPRCRHGGRSSSPTGCHPRAEPLCLPRRKEPVEPHRRPFRFPALTVSRCSSGLRQSGLRLCDDRREGFALVHRDVGRDLPVQFDACQLAPVHELRIGQTLGADTGVDTLDPQTTEGPLLNLAVAIRILTSLFDGWRAMRMVFLRRP